MSEKVNKFKVGDKIIRVSEGWSDMPLDSVWVVEYVMNNEEIRVHGIDHVNWLSKYFEPVTEETNASQNESISKSIESDGGRSDYYFTSLPKHLIDQIVETGGIEIKDIARYVYDNDADAFNITKAQKRIIEARKGKGKAGIDLLYDANKIKFFASEQYEAIKQEGSL
jgi:hypothetical protein